MSELARELRAAWESAVAAPALTGDELGPLAGALRQYGPPSAREPIDDEVFLDVLWYSVVAARIAFGAPEHTVEVFDHLAESFLSGTPFRFEERRFPARIAERLRQSPWALPEGFWGVVRENLDPATITLAIAALGAGHPAWLRDAQARAMRAHEGFESFLAQPPMPRTRLENLESCAEGTLGHTFRRLILDNGFDVEVLDPDIVRDYHPGHDAANRRILQTHEIWHLVAGFSTSPLHEVAITGFQLAQFGHPYSRTFLATALTLSVLTTPSLAPFAIQVALEGWRHGRRTPPLMPVNWDGLWDEAIQDIRSRLGIETFQSVIPDALAAT